jgi:hypothetical protein
VVVLSGTPSASRPGRQTGRAHPRGKPGFQTYKSGCGRETDSLLDAFVQGPGALGWRREAICASTGAGAAASPRCSSVTRLNLSRLVPKC